MTSRRIRYKAGTSPHMFKSVQTFTHSTNGARYKVVLNLQAHEFQILDEASNAVAKSGHAAGFHPLKKKAREALEALGIETSRETRTERKAKA